MPQVSLSTWMASCRGGVGKHNANGSMSSKAASFEGEEMVEWDFPCGLESVFFPA